MTQVWLQARAEDRPDPRQPSFRTIRIAAFPAPVLLNCSRVRAGANPRAAARAAPRQPASDKIPGQSDRRIELLQARNRAPRAAALVDRSAARTEGSRPPGQSFD